MENGNIIYGCLFMHSQSLFEKQQNVPSKASQAT